MSYYKPSFDHTASMTRGRGYSPRGYRGGSGRGGSWGGGRGGYVPRGGGRNFDSFSSSFDSRPKYGSSSDRYSGSRGHDDFRKSYRMDSSYSSGRDSGHRSPERKRPRNEAPSSRHDSSYGGYGSSASRYDSSYPERRSFSSDRHPAPLSRRDDFRRPSGPPRGGYRGRISSRGSRGLKFRDRPPRRRLIESSYAVRKRIIPSRASDYARRLKISKMRSAIAARKKRESDKEDSDEEEMADKDEEKNEEDEKKENADGEEEEGTAKKTSNEKEDGSDKEDKGESNKEEPTTRKTFIKLNCPHCGIKAVTFRKYDLHLQGRTHMMSMRKISIKQKSILAQMRLAQRNAQNELEKTSDDLAPRTNFCPLCKLNYKQRKAVHQNSEAHKNMKKFLMPYCKLCSITFKSPMMYESHCCSIEHLKRKQRVENGENSDEFDDETNLENFTTIDSVGVDGDASEEDDKKDINKEPVNVGIEQIRKVEAYYCDLCKMYVGRGSDEMIPSVLARHCKQRTHMQRYIRYKEDKDLEKRAEKLQRKETAEKEDKERQTKENSTDETVTTKQDGETEKEGKDDEGTNKPVDDEEARDDKLWADVDKDLDDILAKEEGTKSSDEDEDGERYDRFKYSEKNGDEKVVKEGEEAETVATEAKTEAVAAEK